MKEKRIPASDDAKIKSKRESRKNGVGNKEGKINETSMIQVHGIRLLVERKAGILLTLEGSGLE